MRYAVLLIFVLAGLLFVCALVEFSISGGGEAAAMVSSAASLLGLVISCVYGD
jgi:hypothetical protein